MDRRTHLLALALMAAARAIAQIEGGALDGDRVLTWGDRVRAHDLISGVARTLAKARYGPGGCAFDANGDGRTDLVLLDPAAREAVWLEAPHWTRRVIDTGADFSDCVMATLFGRRGVIVVHRRAQVRFYEPPARGGKRWPYREIYSIYTPSAQGGLLTADVDGDGRADILCGNYWIQAPEKFELPWRLFAIGDWWERERSAMLRLALVPGEAALVAAQAEESPARAARFERPEDPRQFWTARRLDAAGGVHRAGAMLAVDGRIYLGENNGAASRLLVFEGDRSRAIPRVEGVVGLWLWRERLVVIGPSKVELLARP